MPDLIGDWRSFRNVSNSINKVRESISFSHNNIECNEYPIIPSNEDCKPSKYRRMEDK